MKIVNNISHLCSQPELGMGFQFCKQLNENGNSHYIVLNSVLALTKFEITNENSNRKIERIMRAIDSDELRQFGLHHYDLRDEFISGFELESGNFEIENSSLAFFDFIDGDEFLKNRYVERQLHQSPPFLRSARSSDYMFRFSILRNDPRIGSQGELTAGTYATTSSEVGFVLNGLAAVGRYALPALLPRCHRFKISPPDGIEIKIGACQPNFGQAGGGVEIEFTMPLPAGSVSFDGAIPEF
jgi:hypothetical protein